MNIEKIIRYLEIKSAQPAFTTLFQGDEIKNTPRPFPKERKTLTRKGLCQGFSVTHSYMAACGPLALQWWQSVLIAISKWDGSEAALQNKIELPSTTIPTCHVTKTLDVLMNQASNYVLYNQGFGDKDGMPERSLVDFLNPGSAFISEKGRITEQAVIAGTMNHAILSDMLTPDIFSQEALFLISSNTHSCSIRHTDKCWFFYNPYVQGERCFENKDDLINEIHKVMGKLLDIHIATWNSEVSFLAFKNRYEKLLKSNAVTVIKNTGLHAIAIHAPWLLSLLTTYAEKEPTLRDAISSAVKEKTNASRTGLHVIAQYAPESLPALIALAEKEPTLRAAISNAVKETVNGGWNGPHFIARHAPASLPALIASPEKKSQHFAMPSAGQ